MNSLIPSTEIQLPVFNFEDQSLRVIVHNGESWFVAKDLCKILNLTNSRVALQALDGDEKGVSSTYTLGGSQKLAIVSEGGMWTLILRCRDAITPGTVPFRVRKWVTSEVLPSIRKTGSYSTEKIAVTLSESEATTLGGLLRLIPYFSEIQRQAEDVLRAAQSPLAPKMFDAWHEPLTFCSALKGVAERCGKVERQRTLCQL